MSSIQRKRGQTCIFYGREQRTNARGEVQWRPNYNDKRVVRVAEMPERSAKAEVPGQQQINIVVLICPPDLIKLTDDQDMGIWSEVEYHGKTWDIAAPPSYHHGTRATRHWTVTLRERPQKVGANRG